MIEPTLNYVPCPVATPAAPAQGMRRMAYWEWNATGNPHHPHVVLCVHGLARQGRDFDVLARSLATQARIICPDVAGRGQSDWLADPQGYQVPLYGMDMLTLLAQLHQQAPISTLDWVGTSMGGLIALGLLGQRDLPLPVRVRRLVLNDVGPVIEWQALARIGEYVGQMEHFDSVEQATQALWEMSGQHFGPHTPEQWQALCRPQLRPHPEGGWTLHYDPAIAIPFRALAQATPEMAKAGEAAMWQLYEHITAQTLLLRGAQSDLLSAATAAAMTQRGPKARLVEFDNVGHAPTLVAAEQVAVVRDFLFSEQ